MDRSYSYSRRLLSRARMRKRVAAGAIACVMAACGVFMLTWEADPISAASPQLLALDGSADAAQGGVRRIYPYSVVPGGVADGRELQRVIRTDRVVAAHYASFDAGKARAVVVDKPRTVHVSYRKGDKVYWTAHKVALAPGETLLSDGTNEMRARCANRISDVPQYPVEAHRPAMEELDQPVALSGDDLYALGPDGLPVAMDEGAMGRAGASRFPVRAGGGSGARASDGAQASAMASDRSGAGPLATMRSSGSSGSLGSRPRPGGQAASTPAPAPAADSPTPVADAGSGTTGSSGAPLDPGPGTPTGGMPDQGAGAPGPAPGTGNPKPAPGGPDGDPQPQPAQPGAGATPSPGSGLPPPQPARPSTPLTGEDSGGGGLTEPAPLPPANPGPPAQPGPQPEPESGPQPGVPVSSPDPVPRPPLNNVEQPDPTEIPEPASIWLFVLALGAMAVLARRRRA